MKNNPKMKMNPKVIIYELNKTTHNQTIFDVRNESKMNIKHFFAYISG